MFFPRRLATRIRIVVQPWINLNLNACLSAPRNTADIGHQSKTTFSLLTSAASPALRPKRNHTRIGPGLTRCVSHPRLLTEQPRHSRPSKSVLEHQENSIPSPPLTRLA